VYISYTLHYLILLTSTTKRGVSGIYGTDAENETEYTQTSKKELKATPNRIFPKNW